MKTKKQKVVGIILKSLIIVAVVGVMATLGYFILRWCGFTTVEDFTRLRNALGDNFIFWLVVGCLQMFQVIFIPISNQIITVPLALLFPPSELWKVFLTSWLSIWFATLILYVIGRFAGKKILNWLLRDKEQTEKCANFLKKGWVFYPIGMLTPLPDDVITILAGTGKMNFWFIMGSSFITRAIDVACSVWGLGYLTRYWWGWIIMGVAIALLGVATFIFWKLQRKLDKNAKKN